MKIVPLAVRLLVAGSQASRPTVFPEPSFAVQSNFARPSRSTVPLLELRVVLLSNGSVPVVHVAALQFAFA